MNAHARPGIVRIVGGRLRNSRLQVPDLPGLRPTPQRVRETLFNWLAPVIDGARCLDLFAGTGALGIEASSRGAGQVMLVERDAVAAQGLRANVTRLHTQNVEVVQADAIEFLQRAPAGPACDLIFLDPPFGQQLWEAAAQALEHYGWLAAQAWIYVESPRATALTLPASWQPYRQGQAGEVAYALYRRSQGVPLS